MKVYRVTIGQAPDVQVLNLASGWNLVSFGITPVNPAVDAVFGITGRQTILDQVYQWDPLGQVYQQVDELEANRGYWVYSNVQGGTVLTVFGFQGGDTIALEPGWNIVGPTQDVGIPDTERVIDPDSDAAIETGIFGFDTDRDEYIDVDHTGGTLRRGEGYWIKAKEATEIPAQ